MKRLFSTPKRCLITAALVLLVVATVITGVWVHECQAVRASIKQRGGRMTTEVFGRVYFEGEPFSRTSNGTNSRFAQALGHPAFRPFHTVTGISFNDHPLTDDELSEIVGRLQQPEQLDELDLSWTRITDRGVRELSQLSQLQFLALSHTRVTDAGLKNLRKLRKLETLRLSNTGITDSGLESLSGLSRLRGVVLSETEVTDRGMKHLIRCRNLQHLSLDGTAVTDAGMKPLAKLPRLLTVEVSNTGVTDEGLRILKKGQPQVSVYDD